MTEVNIPCDHARDAGAGGGGGAVDNLVRDRLHRVSFQLLAPLHNLPELVDDESVERGKHGDWSKPEEDLTDHQVCLEHAGLTDLLILLSLPATAITSSCSLLLNTPDMVLETQRDVDKDADQEGEADVDLGILGSVEPLCGPVDGHADDDVERAGHEGVGSFKCAW